MDRFVLKAPYQASGDQPEAIAGAGTGFEEGPQSQVLLGDGPGLANVYHGWSVSEKVQIHAGDRA